jgi:hypothetical protein
MKTTPFPPPKSFYPSYKTVRRFIQEGNNLQIVFGLLCTTVLSCECALCLKLCLLLVTGSVVFMEITSKNVTQILLMCFLNVVNLIAAVECSLEDGKTNLTF